MYQTDVDLELGHTEKDHVCSLPAEDDLVVRYIDSGWLVQFRRRMKKLLTVSETNPRAKTCLKSTYAIRQEKTRHLKHYYYMIHPFSEARTFWEFFMMFVFLASLIIIPIELARLETTWYLKIPKLSLDLLCCVDICVTFVTGYYDTNQRRVILLWKMVAKHYIMEYFLVDLVSSIPVDTIIAVISKKKDTVWWVKIFTVLKILRVTTFIKYLDRFCTRMQYSQYRYKFIRTVILFMLGLTWCTCITFMIERFDFSKWKIDYSPINYTSALIDSCYRAVYNFLLVGYGTSPLKEIPDIIITLVFLCGGFVLEIYIYVQMLLIFHKDSSATNKYQRLMQQLTEYVRYKELPERLRKRMVLYFEYKYQKRFFREQEVLSTISGQLRREIILHNCQKLLQKAEYFQNLPITLLLRLSSGMRSEIYLADDVIMRTGDVGDAMYFISSGSVAVYSPSGEELCHLSDGHYFGELAVITDDDMRVMTVVAIECCELLVLKAADFRKAVLFYPEYQERMQKMAVEKLLRSIAEKEDEEEEEKEEETGEAEQEGSDVKDD